MASKLELPDLPALEAPAQEHLDFANRALKRKWNLVVRVRKYSNVAPLIVLVLENGDEFPLTATQHRYGAGLVDILASYDGQLSPSYTAPQLRVIYAALIRASDLWEADAWHDELLLDLNSFVGHCLHANDHLPLQRPEPGEDANAALYRAIADFQTINQKRTGVGESFPVLLFWHYPPDFNQRDQIEMWIPRASLLTYLRTVRNWTSGPQLRNALHWFGWQHRHLQARSKGDWRRRAHTQVWSVPVPWEACETDLLTVANGGSVSPPSRRT